MPIQLPTYGQGEEGHLSAAVTSPYNLTDPSARRLVLQSLSPNTNYSVIICARTSVGCGNTTTAIGLTNEDGE